MSLVRRLQKKGVGLYLCIPHHYVGVMDLRPGQHVLIHSINSRQLMMTKIVEEVAVIVHGEEEA